MQIFFNFVLFTSSQMNNCTACKVMETIDIQPSTWMPSPMSNNRIDETSNQDTIKNVGIKVTAFSQGSRHQGCSSGCKDKLEEPLGIFVLQKRLKVSHLSMSSKLRKMRTDLILLSPGRKPFFKNCIQIHSSKYPPKGISKFDY